MKLVASAVFVLSSLALGLSLGAAPALADPCKLDQPIPVSSGSLLDYSILLHNARFDQTPRWDDPQAYNPATDSIDLQLFNIVYGSSPTGFLGASVAIANKSESVGFSKTYVGSFGISGSTSTSNGKVTYTTRNSYKYSEPQHATNEAVTETIAVVEGGKLVSLQLTAPVHKVWKVEQGVRYIAFTGEHQTLCLKSAD